MRIIDYISILRMSLLKKNIFIIVKLVIVIIGCIYLIKPSIGLLKYFNINEDISFNIADNLFRILILIYSLNLVYTLKLNKYCGLKFDFKNRNLKILFIPFLILIAIFCLTILKNIQNITFHSFVLLAISNIIVGFSEEVSMRGVILPLLIRMFSKNKRGIILSLLISSFIFAILHYITLLHGIVNFTDTTNQVILAFGGGMIFGSLMLRSQNIVVISLLHGAANIVGSISEIIEKEPVIHQHLPGGYSFNLIYVFVILLIVISIILLKKVNQNEIIAKIFS